MLIINADDFGLTPGVNAAILDSHRNGVVTSASLMANGAAFDAAVEMSHAAPRLGVGLHLNLVEGRPVAASADVASLVDASGCFRGKWSLVRRSLCGAIDPGHVRRETAAQIHRLRAAGIEPTHLDSHQHVHSLPGLFPEIIETALGLGVTAVRVPFERLSGNMYPPRLGGMARVLALRATGRSNRRKLETTSMRSPAEFAGIAQTGRLSADWILNWLARLQSESAELMAHPGYPDEPLRKWGGRLQSSRLAEYKALTDPRLPVAIERLGIRLINFAELPPMRVKNEFQKIAGRREIAAAGVEGELKHSDSRQTQGSR